MPDITPDGHFVAVNGRRWRATDPAIPPERVQVLRAELMKARRDVGTVLHNHDGELEGDARARVHRARTALGERGTPWWEQTVAQRRPRWSE